MYCGNGMIQKNIRAQTLTTNKRTKKDKPMTIKKSEKQLTEIHEDCLELKTAVAVVLTEY